MGGFEQQKQAIKKLIDSAKEAKEDTTLPLPERMSAVRRDMYLMLRGEHGILAAETTREITSKQAYLLKRNLFHIAHALVLIEDGQFLKTDAALLKWSDAAETPIASVSEKFKNFVGALSTDTRGDTTFHVLTLPKIRNQESGSQIDFEAGAPQFYNKDIKITNLSFVRKPSTNDKLEGAVVRIESNGPEINTIYFGPNHKGVIQSTESDGTTYTLRITYSD